MYAGACKDSVDQFLQIPDTDQKRKGMYSIFYFNIATCIDPVRVVYVYTTLTGLIHVYVYQPSQGSVCIHYPNRVSTCIRVYNS